VQGIVLGPFLDGGIPYFLVQKIMVASLDKGVVAQGQVFESGTPGEQAVVIGCGRLPVKNDHTVRYIDIAIQQTVRTVLELFDTDRNQILVVAPGAAL
jgi:hypothetical protein